MQQNLTEVTLIYYHDESLKLQHEVHSFFTNKYGRVVIPKEFKIGISIIAVCEGKVKILNKIGDRILPMNEVAEHVTDFL